MLGLRILEGVIDCIILTKVLCDDNVGFLYKDSYALVCALKENLRIKVSGLFCVSIFMNNDPVHFILNAFKGKLRLSLELNKIPFYERKV